MNKFKEKMQGLWGWIDSLPSIVWAAAILSLIIGIIWLCAVFPAFKTAIAFGLV